MFKTDTRLVRLIFEMNGLIPTDRHDWNILWTNSQGGPGGYFFERLTPHTQKVNHFPCSTNLTRKDRMALNIKSMLTKYSYEYFNIIPETYVLPQELEAFQAAFGKRTKGKNLWIVKPSCSSQGKGIYLIDSLSQLPKIDHLNDSFVVSRYIDNPLLLGGHKFDLRIYVLVTSYDPLRVYVYREGLVRFASEKYDLSKVATGPQT